MSAVAQTDPDFAFAGLDTPEAPAVETAAPSPHTGGAADPLGALAGLLGTWKGHGFNAIWRPHHPAAQQDRFLELNMTDETLVFTRINGPIPNRGLAMADINMFGLTYMQQISESSTGAGLHIEPGIWAAVPHTTDPNEPATVVRMGSIPHGTTIMAQGVAQVLAGGPQNIPDNNILPFFFGSPAPANGDFNSVSQTFTELNLGQATQFRFTAPGVTQNIVKNPNSVLQNALQASLQGTHMTSRTFLHVASTHNIVNNGGGTSNTAFLSASTNPPGGNAKATQVEATFWIETIAGTGGHPDTLQLQYTQLVMLDFNGIHWPHVTVGTLVKQ
jgi:hypothetical protein